MLFLLWYKGLQEIKIKNCEGIKFYNKLKLKFVWGYQVLQVKIENCESIESYKKVKLITCLKNVLTCWPFRKLQCAFLTNLNLQGSNFSQKKQRKQKTIVPQFGPCVDSTKKMLG
jgi:hypothetical protein